MVIIGGRSFGKCWWNWLEGYSNALIVAHKFAGFQKWGSPKWFVYLGKSHENGWSRGTPFQEIPMWMIVDIYWPANECTVSTGGHQWHAACHGILTWGHGGLNRATQSTQSLGAKWEESTQADFVHFWNNHWFQLFNLTIYVNISSLKTDCLGRIFCCFPHWISRYVCWTAGGRH